MFCFFKIKKALRANSPSLYKLTLTTGKWEHLFSYFRDLRNYINWGKRSKLLKSPVDPRLQICQRACWTIKPKQWWSKWKFNVTLSWLHNVLWPIKHFPIVHKGSCHGWCKSPGGRDLGLPFKLAPRSFNLVPTTKGKKETGRMRGLENK